MLNAYCKHYTGIPKTCWLGIIFTFIESLVMGISFFLTIYFVDSLHFTIAEAGVFMSFYGMGAAIGGITSGKLADHITPKYVSFFCLLMQALLFLLLTQLVNAKFLIVNLFLLGIVTYGFLTSNSVFMLSGCQSMPQIRLKAINVSRAALNAGFGISGIIIGFIASSDFKRIFYSASLLLFLAAIYLILFRKDQAIIFKQNENLNPKPISKAQHGSLLLFLLVLMCSFSIGLIIAQLSATYPLYLKETFVTLGVKAVSILFTLDAILIIIFQAPLVNSLNKSNKVLCLGIGAFLMGFGMLILSFSFHYFLIALLSCVIWTTGEMIFIAMAQFICYEGAKFNKKGQRMGMYQTTNALSKIIGPSAGGFIYYHFGGNTLWQLSGIIGITCFITCFYLRSYGEGL